MIGFGRRVRRTRSGQFQLRIPERERALLRPLPAQMRELLADDEDPALRRLFPPAYSDDVEANEDFHKYMHDDLVDRRLQAASLLEETLDAERLDEEQLLAWMGALNDIRLVLGTRLDVTEESQAAGIDPDDPRAPMLALYGYLGWLQEQVVEALADG